MGSRKDYNTLSNANNDVSIDIDRNDTRRLRRNSRSWNQKSWSKISTQVDRLRRNPLYRSFDR
jgi:hypothetical protein